MIRCIYIIQNAKQLWVLAVSSRHCSSFQLDIVIDINFVFVQIWAASHYSIPGLVYIAKNRRSVDSTSGLGLGLGLGLG